MKTIKCRQCGRDLPESHFKQYQSRSKGQRSSTVSRYTICKTCEKMEAYAAKVHKKLQGLLITDKDEEYVMLRTHYQRLMDAGLDVVTASARRLMGLPPLTKRRGAPNRLADLLESYNQPVDPNQYEDTPPRPRAAHKQEPVEGHTLNDAPEDFAEGYTLNDVEIDTGVEQLVDNVIAYGKFADQLQELLTCELTEPPQHYDEMCDKILADIRQANNGVVPDEYDELASQVLDRLDDYADSYEG